MNTRAFVVTLGRAGERAAARRIGRALARAGALAERDFPFAQATLAADRLTLAAPGLRRRLGGRLGPGWTQLLEEARAGARGGGA